MGSWALTPKQSIESECERRGAAAVIDGCVAILVGGDVDDSLLSVLAGPAAQTVLAGGEGGREGYWPRVWATRGLLYAWDPSAAQAIAAATRDDAWRVREMAAKVVAKHALDDVFDDMLRLRDDPVTRVRTAAERALVRLSRAGG